MRAKGPDPSTGASLEGHFIGAGELTLAVGSANAPDGGVRGCQEVQSVSVRMHQGTRDALPDSDSGRQAREGGGA